MKYSEGFITVNTFFLLLAMSIAVAGMSAALLLIQSNIERQERFLADYDTMISETKNVIERLNNDPTPPADSVFDPVWSYINSKSGEYGEFKLSDLSSRLNPNWIHPLLFERTKLKNLLYDGISPDSFRDYREKEGFSMDIQRLYGKIIRKDALAKYFTPYGYLNVNTAYEFSVEKMYGILTGDRAAAEVFHGFIKESLSKRHLITEREILESAGSYYKMISPVITAQPAMNVNFIPRLILEEVLAYPYGGKESEGSVNIADSILEERRWEEITPGKLDQLVNADNTRNRVLHYLGTKTWFWKLEISNGRTKSEAVISCLPSQKDSDKYTCRLYSFRTDHLKDNE